MTKFGSNTKAEEGRQRKAAQKELKNAETKKKQSEKEEAEWQVGSKTKSTKQVQEEQKKLEKAQKKAEKDRLEAEEAAELAKLRPLKPLPKEKSTVPVIMKTQTSPVLRVSTPLSQTSNSNDSLFMDDAPEYGASNIDDALFLLSRTSSSSLNVVGTIERHPERRAKAAFAAFEEREMPRLKEEYPGLRLSQLRERLQRLWQKSPENPFNQTHITYNSTKSQEILKASNETQENLDRLRL